MLSDKYSEVNSGVSWYCPRCDSHNVDSFTYRSYEIPVRNPFSALSLIPGDDSVHSVPSCFRPTRYSSPTNPGQQPTTSPASQTFTSNSSAVSNHPPNKTNNQHTMIINCNSVKNRKAELENMVDYLNPDVMILDETKIDS